MPRLDEKKLLKDLQKRGFESITIGERQSDGRVKVDANKLHPLSGEKDPIYAPIPVTLSVSVDAKGGLAGITGDTPDPASVAAAVHQVKALRETGQLQDTSGAAAAVDRPTHSLIRDEKGRRVVRRQRFSAA